MSDDPGPRSSKTTLRARPSRGGAWLSSLLLGLLLIVVYSANGGDISSDDTVATSMLPLTILRGEGVYLDRFESILLQPDGTLPVYVVRSRGHIVSRYPVAPAILVVPLAAPQVWLLDQRVPGWDRKPWPAFNECMWMAKRAMALLMAVAGMLLHRLLLGLGLSRVALPAVVAAALGSDLWVVGSQALWQHGPAALALLCALALLHPAPVPSWRLVLAGVAMTLLFTSRLLDAVFAAVSVAWLARTQARGLAWFLPPQVLGAVALLVYNLWFFGSIAGGQAQLEQLHSQLHGLPGAWCGNVLEGAAGTLISPNRGLFVFSPWVFMALVAAIMPPVARSLGRHRLVCWLLGALVPYFAALSMYAVWWGGHCFGPRYWTDVMPLFAILFAFGLDWLAVRSRVLYICAGMTIVFSIGVQTVGAFCYPSSWNLSPANVDVHHERLWDWRDTELARCLFESRLARAR